jgi:hypothetical protein
MELGREPKIGDISNMLAVRTHTEYMEILGWIPLGISEQLTTRVKC